MQYLIEINSFKKRRLTLSILAECPVCGRKQRLSAKVCKVCSNNMDKSKQSRTVRYWHNYRLPGGKQRREPVGYSIEEARDADGKRRVQKRENRIFDMLPESKMTFQELTDWYLKLATVKALASYRRIESSFANFNKEFGSVQARDIKPERLEHYQVQRESEGAALATIDMEISIAKTMVSKAFDNDLVDGRVLKAFRKVKRRLKPGGNARKRIVFVPEYLKIIAESPQHLKGIVVTAYNTGMRMGEILELRWSYVDRENEFIRLPPELPKEKKPKNIPINHHVAEVFDMAPRAIHHDYVFTYHGNSFSEGGIKRSFSTACKNAGVPYGRKTDNGITFHDIRRTVKTHLLYAGVDKVRRDAIVGHSLKGMDAHYIVLSDESLKDAMEQYTVWLDEKIDEADRLLKESAEESKSNSG
jgi:integrase